MYIYISNEEQTPIDVFFDDFKVTQNMSEVVAGADYYPYGLPAYTWIREGEQETREKFQGKEYDPQTGWADHGSRQYDPVLGRWFADDPKGELMPYISNYAAMMNNPVMYTDPDGECPICIAIIVGAAIGAGSSAVVYTATALASDNFS